MRKDKNVITFPSSHVADRIGPKPKTVTVPAAVGEKLNPESIWMEIYRGSNDLIAGLRDGDNLIITKEFTIWEDCLPVLALRDYGSHTGVVNILADQGKNYIIDNVTDISVEPKKSVKILGVVLFIQRQLENGVAAACNAPAEVKAICS